MDYRLENGCPLTATPTPTSLQIRVRLGYARQPRSVKRSRLPMFSPSTSSVPKHPGTARLELKEKGVWSRGWLKVQPDSLDFQLS